jgi:predicted nucleic acid-binding protein
VSLVVDASVAFKLFVQEPDSGQARALLASGRPWVAPDLVLVEVANAAWRQQRRGEMATAQLEEVTSSLPQIYAELVPLDGLFAASLRLAQAIDHPVYDCCYVALAQQRALDLVTADARLATRLRDARVPVVVQRL